MRLLWWARTLGSSERGDGGGHCFEVVIWRAYNCLDERELFGGVVIGSSAKMLALWRFALFLPSFGMKWLFSANIGRKPRLDYIFVCW